MSKNNNEVIMLTSIKDILKEEGVAMTLKQLKGSFLVSKILELMKHGGTTLGNITEGNNLKALYYACIIIIRGSGFKR